MSKNAELSVETIVTCPNCRQQNRLSRQTARGIYHCSQCHHQLTNAVAASTASSISNDVKGLGWFLIVTVLLGVTGLITFYVQIVSSERSVEPLSSDSTPLSISSPRSVSSPSVPSPSVPSPSVILQNRLLPDSEVLVPPAWIGDGQLKISNGTVYDAHVKLVDPASHELIAVLYVKSKSDFTLEQIPDGTYAVLFTTGEDWDAKTESFTRSYGFTKFDKSLEFVTTQLTDGIQYTIIELTLNPVANGNVTLSGINEQEFSQYQ